MKNLILILSILSIVFTNSEAKNKQTFFVEKSVTIQHQTGDVTLKAGTPIVVELMQANNTVGLNPGQSVNVRVKFNVVVNKKTLIAAGAMGSATITNVKKPKPFGRPGNLELLIQSITSVDNQQIPVSGMPMLIEGEDKKGLAIGLSLVTWGLAGIFIKGKPAELRAGTMIHANVASDSEINVSNY